MKISLLKAGKCVVMGGMLLSAQLRANGVSVVPTEHVNVKAIVDTMDAALTLGMSEHQGGGATLSRIEADMKKLREICAKMEATDEQKVLIRDELFAFKEKTLPIETNLKLARLKFLQNALSASGLEADATTQVTAAVNAVSAIAQAKGDLVTKILFQTLKPEQRKPALVCMAAMKLCEHDHEMEGHAID